MTPKSPQKGVEKRYCSRCGSEMMRLAFPAEKVREIGYEWTDAIIIPLGRPYDRRTGKRQYGYVWKCPNYPIKKWSNFFIPSFFLRTYLSHDVYDEGWMFTDPKSK